MFGFQIGIDFETIVFKNIKLYTGFPSQYLRNFVYVATDPVRFSMMVLDL
jgi:hypothetical protein